MTLSLIHRLRSAFYSAQLRRSLFTGALGLVCGAGVAFHVASAASAPPKPETPFAQHIRQAGIKSCSNVFSALGEMLTADSRYVIESRWRHGDGDAHAVQAVAGLSYAKPQYKAQAVGVVFAAPVAGGCEGNMVRVAPYPETCEAVVKRLPTGSTLARTLTETPLYNLADGEGQAMLLSVGGTCIVVSVGELPG